MAELRLDVLERDLERKDDLTRRLRDQCRYQHLVLSEIHSIAREHAHWEGVRMIIAKAQAALSSVSKSGLLA